MNKRIWRTNTEESFKSGREYASKLFSKLHKKMHNPNEIKLFI